MQLLRQKVKGRNKAQITCRGTRIIMEKETKTTFSDPTVGNFAMKKTQKIPLRNVAPGPDLLKM